MSFGNEKLRVLVLKKGKEYKCKGIDLGEGVIANEVEIEGLDIWE